MAEIRPFRGLRYDPSRSGAADSLLAPPYDVIDDPRREALAASSEHNCVRVILPEGEGDARYEVAAAELARIRSEAMTVDDSPGYYVYHQQFQVAGRTHVRKGFIALVELTAFGDGPVKPHERTLAGPKEDRLKLMRACEAHLELVFALFSDPDREWERPLEEKLGDPVMEADFDDARHLLFRVSDPQVIEELTAALAGKSIYIADGHHRYETMCAYRRELEAAGTGAADTSRYGMIFLSNLDDPGLVVLPTHRVVHGVAAVDLDALVAGLAPHFEVEVLPLPEDPEALREALGGEETVAFGLAVPGTGRWRRLTLRGDFDPAQAGLGSLAEALRELDVVLLHELVLEHGLGIDKAAQAAKTNLYYQRSTEGALDACRRADATVAGAEIRLVCLMKPTSVHQVVAVCDSGEVMPQKSTYFFPKIPTGLAMHLLGEGPA